MRVNFAACPGYQLRQRESDYVKTHIIYGMGMVAALIGSALCPGRLSAGSITYIASGTDSDGAISASVMFTAVTGGFDITVTNTGSGTFAKGQAVSDFAFTVGGGLSTPTAFTELKGVMFDPVSGGSWTLASGTPFDNTLSPTPAQPYAIDHWGFQTTGSNVVFATAGSPVPGAGNPTFMILPSSGTAGTGNSLANSNFDPFIIGPADFFLTVPGVTASTLLDTTNIFGVSISFGTGPEADLTPDSTPEPSSLVLSASGLGLLGAVGFFRSRRRRYSVGA